MFLLRLLLAPLLSSHILTAALPTVARPDILDELTASSGTAYTPTNDPAVFRAQPFSEQITTLYYLKTQNAIFSPLREFTGIFIEETEDNGQRQEDLAKMDPAIADALDDLKDAQAAFVRQQGDQEDVNSAEDDVVAAVVTWKGTQIAKQAALPETIPKLGGTGEGVHDPQARPEVEEGRPPIRRSYRL